MTTTLYIGNDMIRVMSGQTSGNRVTIKTCGAEPLDEGNILNGVLLNPGVIQSKLDALFANMGISKRGVRLVVDGTSITIKVLHVPLMAPKKTLALMQSEFTDINLNGMLMDYSIITPKNEEGSASILATVVQREFIESYVNLCKESKIELEAIDISTNCIIKLCKKIKSLHNMTYTMMYLDRNMLVQNLFVNGIFKMTKRDRILSNPGTDEFDSEIAKHVMAMIQFNRSERNGTDIGAAYLCDFPQEVRAKFPQYKDALGIEVADFPTITGGEIALPAGVVPTEWAYNLGAMHFTK